MSYLQGGGTGTETDPYLISTAQELVDLVTAVNDGNTYSGKFIKLTNNIDLSLVCGPNVGEDGTAVNWTPIGNKTHYFRGTFDGAGHEITGLYINASTSDYQGLFGYLYYSTITNLGVSGTVTGRKYVGSVVGYCYYGKVTNCYNTGSVKGSASIGGVVGCNTYATVTGCYNTGSVTGSSSNIGGVVGYCNKGTVTSCYNTGSVTNGIEIGGVVGYCSTGTVTSCYNTGSVTGSNYIGGVVGECYSNSTVTNCYNTGSLTDAGTAGNLYLGGVLGYNLFNEATITNCYYLEDTATGGINGTNVIGQAEVKTAEDFSLGAVAYLLNNSISGKGEWGQTLNGTNADKSPILMSFYDAAQQERKKVYTHYLPDNSIEYTNDASAENTPCPYTYDNDGICRDQDCLEPYQPCIQNSNGVYQIKNAGNLAYFAELVNTAKAGDAVLLNDIDLTPICSEQTAVNWIPIGNSDNKFRGNFDGNNYQVTGLYINDSEGTNKGLFGCVNGGTIKNLSVAGAILGEEAIGGIAGKVESGNVTNCHNNVTVSGCMYTGGVIGYIANNTTVESCRNSGKVVGINNNVQAGGVVGYNGSSTVINCCNNGTVEGVSGAAGGVVGQCYGNSFDNSIVTNCYNIGIISAAPGWNGGVVGTNSNSSGSTVTNCYYLTGTAAQGIYSGSGSAEEKSQDQFSSGELAYLLQGTQEAQVWGQTLNGETKDANPVLMASLAAEQQTAKTVYKVTFVTDETTSTVLYANPSGVGEDRMPTEPAAPEGYALRWAQSETADAFTGTTPVTADITLNAYKQEKYGEQDNDKTVTTTYGTAVTQDLSAYVGYAGTTEAAGKFDYAITSEYNGAYFSISGDTLTVSNTVPAGEYPLSITATEKAPQISTFALIDPGTESVEFTVTVNVAKAAALVVTAPAPAENLAAVGMARELVTAGTAEGGTMMYSLDGVNYSENIPTGTDAGVYTVYYKVMGDENHNDTEPVILNVTMVIGYTNTVLKKIDTSMTKDHSTATAVLSEIKPTGFAIKGIAWTCTDADGTYTAEYTEEISGDSTLYFGIIVPALLTAAEETETDQITVKID